MYVENSWEYFHILSLEEQHLSETENFCSIINIFIITFDQFKSILAK